MRFTPFVTYSIRALALFLLLGGTSAGQTVSWCDEKTDDCKTYAITVDGVPRVLYSGDEVSGVTPGVYSVGWFGGYLGVSLVDLTPELREQVAKLMGQSTEEMGHAQWIGHILKRLHLLDDARRKRSTEGMAYAIDLADVQDMMRRYDVDSICKTDS